MKVKRMPFHIVREDSSDEEVQYSGDGEKSKDRGNVEEGGGGMEHEEGDPRENRSKYDEDETVDETSAAPTLYTCEDVQELLLQKRECQENTRQADEGVC